MDLLKHHFPSLPKIRPYNHSRPVTSRRSNTPVVAGGGLPALYKTEIAAISDATQARFPDADEPDNAARLPG